MADLQLSQAAQRAFVQELGFRPDWIADAVADPDDTEVLTFDGGLVIHLYAKKLSQGKKPSVLVVGAQMQPKQFVCFVLRLYEDFDRALDQCTPRELLELVARRFGPQLRVGNVTDRFFLNKSMQATTTNPTEVVGVVNDVPGHEYHGITFFRISPETPPLLTCALVFFLDLTSYRQYLRRWSP